MSVDAIAHTEFPRGYTVLSGADGYVAAHTRRYGTGRLPVPLADGRVFTLDLDELPYPKPESEVR
ncbi:hypothetical protein [Actinacidiphila yeochonensis]|uniref:hypothetical protein n=1 Tax=Actinacidiphila yeochonensis TaxID=89050 RepID=UPI0005647991|nr:hypothetical protein [Actinacidiphila yeochonensis]